jgi:hypothetical protein
MPTRRDLTFAVLDDIVKDAENLLAKGYERAGNWDLAQCCGHLAEWMRFPLDGYPKAPLPLRPVVWLVRVTLGKGMLRKILTTGTFSPGGQTLKETVPTPGGDESAAVAKLRDVVERFKNHDGPFHPSPLFGQMTRDEWVKLNLAHTAHHLSFLVPRQPV